MEKGKFEPESPSESGIYVLVRTCACSERSQCMDLKLLFRSDLM